MTEQKFVTSKLNEKLSSKFEYIKMKAGYDSDAECIRYIINILFDLESHKKDPQDLEIATAINRIEEFLPVYINKNFNGVIPSIEDQLRRLKSKRKNA